MSKQPIPASMVDIKLHAPEAQPPVRDAVQGPPARAGRVALTLRIEPELHRELRAAAYQADTTIQDLILKALQNDGYKSAWPDRRQGV
jgi:hypothetical protein